MQEVAVKTHLIIKEIHDEYTIKWCGKLIDTNPVFKDGLPVFVIISSDHRVELNTLDMKQIEGCAKRIASPHGRQAVTSDTSRIYIKEVGGKETLVGWVRKDHIKKFAPMHDKVGWK